VQKPLISGIFGVKLDLHLMFHSKRAERSSKVILK
jgi:hypothetical protein